MRSVERGFARGLLLAICKYFVKDSFCSSAEECEEGEVVMETKSLLVLVSVGYLSPQTAVCSLLSPPPPPTSIESSFNLTSQLPSSPPHAGSAARLSALFCPPTKKTHAPLSSVNSGDPQVQRNPPNPTAEK